jgi:Icc-related predicted phosphoesterase
MKFIVVSDTHFQHHKLKLPPADAIIHAGDLTETGREDEVLDFLDWFKSLRYQHKIFIAGNHDFFLEKIANTAIEKQLIPSGIHYLNDSGITINGIKLWGSPVQPQYFNWAFNRKRGAEIQKHWNLIPADTDILITHGPPFEILDSNVDGEHVGCRNLLATVGKIRPSFHVFGHIHEAYGKTSFDGIEFLNSSILDENYRFRNKPHEFEFEAVSS